MLVQFMVKEHGVSQRQACKTLSLPRSSVQYNPKSKNDIAVINALHELVERHPSIGFWQSYFRLRRKGFTFSEGGFRKLKNMSAPSILDESLNFLLSPSKYDDYGKERNRRLKRRIKNVIKRRHE